MGFTDTLFGEPDKPEFNVPPEFGETVEARKRLLEITKEPFPKIPRQEIAPLQPLGEERQLARITAKELAQPQDIFSLPEVQGVIQEAVQKGNLLANRLGRSLQAAGTLTSTPGRDVLGRAVTDVQKSLAASLGQFASQERQRRADLIPTLEGLGFTREQNIRGVEQARFDALFRQQTTKAGQKQDFLIPILQFLAGQRPGAELAIEPGRLGIIEQASIVGPFLAGAFGGGGGGGGGGTGGGGAAGGTGGGLAPPSQGQFAGLLGFGR